MRNCFVVFPSVILAVLLLTTACSPKSRLTTADRKFEAGEYASALSDYNKIYGRLTTKDAALRGKIAFNQAECLTYLGQTRNEMLYQRAIRNKYADSIVYLRFAQALHRNGKYGEAAKNYRIFLKHDSTSVLARNGLRGIELASQWKADPTGYVVRRDNHLYARNSFNFSPVFQGAAADMLYFTSSRGQVKKGAPLNFVTNLPNNNVYSIKKDISGKWSKPELVFSEESTAGFDLGAVAFSPDGRTMYFTRASQKNDGNSSLEIVYSSRAGGDWTEPRKINFFRDSTVSVAHPAIAPDGETIYFVSDAPGGFGGNDIWKGTLSGDECKYISNLGPDINTPANEAFPVVRADGTLYFSSDGLPGLGGLDLFKAKAAGENKWIVVNMGVPLNSNFDDFGIAFEGNKETGFFSSNRGQTRGFDFIWSFNLPETEIIVTGTVVDDKQTPIPDALVRLVSNTGQNIRVSTRKDGTYRIKIDKDMECVMLGTARGFLNQAANLSSTGVKGSKTFTVDFVLPAVFRPVQLDKIFFEFAKWNLTADSEKGLQELLKLLKDNPNIMIELSAHTDFVGNNAANQQLSERRAQSVVDYLIKAGVQPERLIAKGYGEEKPFVVDEQTQAKYSFLPVETVLDEAFILGLTKEQQAIANQINRRTEFKVLKMNFR